MKDTRLKYEYYDVMIDNDNKDVDIETILKTLRAPKKTTSTTNDAFDLKTVFKGINDKLFIRLDSAHLQDFFDKVKEGKVSYVTYLDSALDEYRKTGVLPLKSISVLFKNYYGPYAEFYAYNEEIASRVGNILGIPVVYNKTVKCADVINPPPLDVTIGEYIEEMLYPKSKEYHNVSIDYMQYGDITYDSIHRGYLRDDRENRTQHRNQSLRDWFQLFLFKDMRNPHTGASLTIPQRRGLTQEFIPTYFFRKYLLSDSDFDIHNIMIAHNAKEDTYSLAPNFDMERSFNRKWIRFEYEMCLHQDIEFAYKGYPDIVDKFFDGVKTLLSSYKEATAGVDCRLYRKEINAKLLEKATTMLSVYEKVKQSCKDSVENPHM